MPKIKKKLTAEQKRIRKKAKEERQKKYMWVFMSGKQVRVKRPETIEGIDKDEWIEQNAVQFGSIKMRCGMFLTRGILKKTMKTKPFIGN